MRELPELYKLALDHYFGSVMIVDPDLRVLYANRFTAQMLGTTVERLLEMDMFQVVEAGMAERSCAVEARETKQPVYRYILNYCGRGMYVTSRPYLDEKGALEFILTYSLDEQFTQTFEARIAERQEHFRTILSRLSKEDGGPHLVMESPRSRAVFALARQVAASDSSVLLYGESGVGKEAVARYIYGHSRRSLAPFLPVNCAAIPKDLAESEFFGYEKGAFTGASAQGKAGLFELADRGTLFLDELGELPLAIQAKFLRVLESGEFRRLGGKGDLRTDVRIIGATNKDLGRMVEEGTFREDLYYRLNIIPITVPPLRERREDILPLAQGFLARMNREYGREKTLGTGLRAYLLGYPWPGNIRELRNFIERRYITSAGDELEPTEEVPVQAPDRPAPAVRPEAGTDLSRPLREAVEGFERDYIQRVLAQCGGNVSKAARQMGIHRTGLYQKMDRFGIGRAGEGRR